jgi:transcriptional regulator with XRE-family HTH domain
MAPKKKTLAEIFMVNFKRIREERKLTQQAFANVLDISVSYVSMLERGERTPPLTTLDDIADALDVDPLEMLE